MILFHFETSFNLIKKRMIKKWLSETCKEEGMQIGNLNYIFCSDEYLVKKNLEYLNHNTLTDVISFDYSDEKKIHGDIIVSIETVITNAKKYNVDFKEELYRVMVHGLLHLLKYKDNSKTEQKLMREKENYYLEKIT